ncbi:MAG: DUF1405 domain-containing protein [Candidatus Anstonellales archaeon]
MKTTNLRQILILLLIFASIYGIYYYSYAFKKVNIYLWLFVADSPLSIILALAVLLNPSHDPSLLLLRYLSSIALIKYGIWTIFLMAFFHPQVYLSEESLLNSLIFFILPHIGMVALSILTIPYKRTLLIIPASLFFFLNDYVDYYIGVEKIIIPPNDFEAVAHFSIFLSALSSLVVFLLAGNPIVQKTQFFIYSYIKNNNANKKDEEIK